MPLYEYVCNACHYEFEELQKFSDLPIEICPKCEKRDVVKKISLTAFQLKGEGWYKDGYSRPSETPKKEATKDKKPETKASDTTSKKPEAKKEKPTKK
ncbi:MAG: zinc ribbon domain-containing protein [bacterium]|nr:zinc ribbon domain-containing protein [bacterium]MBU1917692.1 zinc ribbon domain-containing protein [bacterium]